MTKPASFETQYTPRTLVIGVDAPYNRTKSMQSYFDEFVSLLKTNNTPFETSLFIKIRSIDPAYFFTKGKLQEIYDVCKKNDIEQVVLSESLTPRQERNLEDFLECNVCDRTGLILEIFEKSAHSAEGKAQVAIAMLQHRRSRISGKGIHMSQQTGALGARGGPGETAKELEARHIDDEIIKINKQLKRIEQSRNVQRKRRLEHAIPHMCLIGYTNVGKSTILNLLTKSSVLAENKLFATLDTTTRELYLNKVKKGIISDTVGFIQQLPHQLIEAFKSTLDELQYAHLLIHVIDISDPNWEHHIGIVNEILQELSVCKDTVYVFNKVDRIEDKDEAEIMIAQYQPHVVISARSKEGIEPLIQFLSNWQPSRSSVN